ncbi:SEC-C motif domain protein [Methylobacterium nodulans ORS 2060]|uniref:SEC-C motif domain protein n=2 Tax=Methylobacterium nodulans TaxID=114616 RepID=B8IP74_METNO|nr:SEC-C motif domain protein [Methylobacterium nodulans ORS 2060]
MGSAMTDAALVEELSNAAHLPELALARAVLAPDSIAEPVLAALDRAAAGENLSVPDATLLFWGLHVLAARRDGRAYAPLLRLMRLPEDFVLEVLGDDFAETAPRVVASLFDGEADDLFAAADDPATDGLLRMSLLGAIAFLTAEGRIEAARTRDFLVRFDEENRAEVGDPAWQGWEDAIGVLGLTDLAERVRDSRRSGRTPPDFSFVTDFERALQEARDNPASRARFDKLKLGYIEDIVDELAWTAEPDPEAENLPDLPLPHHNPYRDVGRNDPCPCGSGKKFKKCCYEKMAARGL